jgi:DNA mismatch repair protein MutS
MTTTQQLSPMMAQWHACKNASPGTILFFRLGDFYETFYDDAVLMAKELNLTLTKRQDVPMSGVPFHASENYIDRLVAKGYRVAIAEQIEDPKLVKGLVKREIVRIITPGTVVNSSLLSEKRNNYLAALTQVNNYFGLCVLDLTTADFRAMEFDQVKNLGDELARLRPSELLISEKCKKNYPFLLGEIPSVCSKEDWYFDHKTCTDILLKQFQLHSLDGFGLKGMIAAINAAGALLNYVLHDLSLKVDHVKILQKEESGTFMAIDRATQRHLELTEPLHEGQDKHTLLHLLDKTATPMGGRLLKEWLVHPLLSVSEITERQHAIAALIAYKERYALSSTLEQIRDLERLIMRIETGFASPRDLLGLQLSLEEIPNVNTHLEKIGSFEKLEELPDITLKIKNAIVESPPLRVSDGGIFKEGFDATLDELRVYTTDSRSWIANYQVQLREETGIKTLKVSFTRAFGYYIEVSRGQSGNIPAHFERRQTLVNAERFVTPELKDYEHKVLTAEEKISQIEEKLFHTLRLEITDAAAIIRTLARQIAKLDALLSLALVAKQYNYVRPIIDESSIFAVKDGRHPVIEASIFPDPFIPNDIHLDQEKNRLMMITGPNMAGKSTFIRQAALIAILAQIGSYVPAKHAHIGIIDKVFSRIGASDDLARGQSTFMVEMAETANILNNATNKSLVILDEIGRGTSTYDGVSIAWAVAEYLLTQEGKSAKTLFATHYLELTEMEKHIPGAVNYNVAIQETESGIVFLHKIVEGCADKSYGIHVARLAGLPSIVLKRAQEILHKLEKKTKTPLQRQLSLFEI